MLKKRFLICTFAALLALLAALLPLGISASDDGVLRETVDLSRPKKDVVGEGYVWQNIGETLKLSGLELHTDDDYGIRLVKGATVELSGKNYISAKKAAIACQGSVTFTGDGSLTLVSEDGIMSYSTENSTVITVRSGSITIEAQSCGIRCESGSVTLSGGITDIAVADGYSLFARELALADCELTANAPAHASGTLRVTAAALDIRSENGAALSADGSIVTEKVSLFVGEAVEAAESYGGEARLRTESSAYRGGTSAILGEGYPRYADVIIAVLAVLLLAALVATPLLRHRAKTAALKKRLEAEGTNPAAR